MANFRNAPSSFFMFCIDDFATKLSIPLKFGNHYKRFLSQVAIELTTTHSAGSRWVRMKRKREKWYIRNGWSHFAKDNNLLPGNLLTFRIIGKSTLEVSIFRQDSCLQEPTSPPPPSPPASSYFDGEDRAPQVWRFVKKLKDCHIQVSRMEVPLLFVVGSKIARKHYIKLENEGGRRWVINLTDRNAHVFSLTAGWIQFVRDSKLRAGNFLLFEFIPKSKNVIKVVKLEEKVGAKLVAAARRGGLIMDH